MLSRVAKSKTSQEHHSDFNHSFDCDFIICDFDFDFDILIATIGKTHSGIAELLIDNGMIMNAMHCARSQTCGCFI